MKQLQNSIYEKPHPYNWVDFQIGKIWSSRKVRLACKTLLKLITAFVEVGRLFGESGSNIFVATFC